MFLRRIVIVSRFDLPIPLRFATWVGVGHNNGDAGTHRGAAVRSNGAAPREAGRQNLSGVRSFDPAPLTGGGRWPPTAHGEKPTNALASNRQCIHKNSLVLDPGKLANPGVSTPTPLLQLMIRVSKQGASGLWR